MAKRTHTRAEKRWCMETILNIQEDLPYQYSAEVQLKLRRKGIEVSEQYIRQCRQLRRFDSRVVEEMEKLARRMRFDTSRIHDEDTLLRKVI